MTNRKKYSRESLLKSKRFAHIQPDFLRAILTKEEYTMGEAVNLVKKFFGGDK